MKIIAGIGLVWLTIQHAHAQHTFSICAVDPVTGEAGSAGASCIANSFIISDVHPGVGVIHTQAAYLAGNQNYAGDLMDAGIAPSAIIDSLVAHDILGDPAVRQYGIVDLIDGGRAASFTGDSCMDWKGHITGTDYSIQGNILLGPEILDGMETAFLNTEGNLACKLMAALQGAKTPGADTRCLDLGISALSAFIKVAQPDDDAELWLNLRVTNVTGLGIDPIDSLQQLFDAIGGCDYTGIPADEGYASPLIAPQPSTDQIFMQLHANWEHIQIFNCTGNSFYNMRCAGETLINIQCSGWPAGIYFYLLTAEGKKPVKGKLILSDI